MKKILLSILLITCTLTVFAEKITPLPELVKPLNMAISDEHIYITENTTVMVYSLKDLKFIKKFGQEGSGPKEFRRFPFGFSVIIIPHKDVLYINSPGKLSIFTKDGEFVKEQPTRLPMVGSFRPFNKGYVGLGFTVDQARQSSSLTLNTYNQDLKKIKEIYKQGGFSRGRFEFPANNPIFYVHGNKLIMPGQDGFEIIKLDAQGNKESFIKRDYKKIAMNNSYKQKIWDSIKKDPFMSSQFDAMKKMMKFPDYFPYIQNLFVVDGKIYILTFLTKDGKSEFFIYHTNGKFIKRIFLPYEYLNVFLPMPSAFKNNKYYRLVDNVDSEEWELHVIDLD